MTDTIAQPVTDEQKAEWSALHEQMRDLHSERESEERYVAHLMAQHVEAGAMTPGEFGLPSPDALDTYRRACETAAKAAAIDAQIKDLRERVAANPYDTVVKAQLEQQRAEDPS